MKIKLIAPNKLQVIIPSDVDTWFQFGSHKFHVPAGLTGIFEVPLIEEPTPKGLTFGQTRW